MVKKLNTHNEGRLFSLDSTPEIYRREWASFTTKDFPENKHAKSGDKVRIVQTDTEDKRPVEDIVWTHECYTEVFKKAGPELVRTYKPLGKENERYEWVNEARIAPWVICVLRKEKNPPHAKNRRSNQCSTTNTLICDQAHYAFA